MNDPVKTLETAIQADGDITLRDGSVVKVKKCQLRQLPVVARFVQKVQALAITDAILADSMTRADGQIDVLMKDPTFISQLIVQLEADTYGLVASFCDLDSDGVANLELDEAMLVISRVVGDNIDFFVRQVLPMVVSTIEKQAVKIEELAAKTGAKA